MADQSLDELAGSHANVRLAEGRRIYAVGDIHGRLDLLTELHGKIRADMARKPARRTTIVHLGDYVDRGPDSAGVIAHLRTASFPGAECLFLRGNHEQFMIDYMTSDVGGDSWIANGGLETLQSYGISMANPSLKGGSAMLRRSVPRDHHTFFAETALMHRVGGIVFVHAGIDPTRTLDRQRPADLMWIREKFLHHPADLDALVVHGHTPRDVPEVTRWRINVDTGAWFSDRLTAAVFEPGHVRFLATL